MARINRRRLELALAFVFAGGAAVFGWTQLHRAYLNFETEYWNGREQAAIEEKYGMSYYRWMMECEDLSKAQRVKDTSETGSPDSSEVTLDECLHPIVVVPSDQETMAAFARDGGVFILIYGLVLLLLGPWLLAMLLMRGIPRAIGAAWGWLTSESQ